MKVLLIGSGGREHALAWKFSSSPLLTKLYCAPGNPGISELADCIDLPNHQDIVHFCHHNKIDLVMVGPEIPLVDGLADLLREENIPVIGPSAKAAQLEGSKGFTKDLCRRYNIPTGDYERFSDAQNAKAYIQQKGAPIVVKADGLAAGKGVIVAMTEQEALDAVDSCFDGSFGSAGAEVVVEEFLDGEEVSFFCLCDGKTAIPLTSAQDHKRVGDGDTGVNTGGMGAYSPAPIMNDDMIERTMREIVEPTMRGMTEMGAPFTGILFIGLMITKKGPELIEYNVRFGDPECQVLMMRLETDLLPVLQATAKGDLSNVSLKWSNDTALTVVLCANGYPQSPEKGSIIQGVKDADSIPHVKVFHAGTALKNGQLIANGGRVLNVTAQGDNVSQAHERAYQAIQKINWPDGFWRKDIGWRAIEKEKQSI